MPELSIVSLLDSNNYFHVHHFSNSVSTFSTTISHAGEEPARPGPPRIRVDITESSGRGVFATRRIGVADLIHTAKPAVSHPSLSKISCVCYLCLKRLKPNNNPLTQNEPFCSEECRQEAKEFYELEKKADWSAYNKYCMCRSLNSFSPSIWPSNSAVELSRRRTQQPSNSGVARPCVAVFAGGSVFSPHLPHRVLFSPSQSQVFRSLTLSCANLFEELIIHLLTGFLLKRRRLW
ncbi:uncharacterized protein [Spinacia oleracea]|uniref:FLZ-type domain-containing protein n=1 Tax=Spinacia oleracea TaxID=3562 RepID=A0ABM3RNS9_SPIOL|nr:uncharacterized protein LOC130471261 [Spinacia oleracea]